MLSIFFLSLRWTVSPRILVFIFIGSVVFIVLQIVLSILLGLVRRMCVDMMWLAYILSIHYYVEPF